MDNITHSERVQVYTELLPRLQQYQGRTVVVKYGGNAMINEELKQQVMYDLVLLHRLGLQVVLVHGGGPEINELMARLNKKPEFVNGLRVTDRDTIDIVQMVLAGKVNKSLVNLLQLKGGRAIGLSGMDGHLIEAELKDERLGFVGNITGINIRPVTDLLKLGYIPVISTVGCDNAGNLYNINGDTAAAHIAGALNAERLILMTDITGICRDVNDPATLIREISVEGTQQLIADGVISGGMIPKVDCCAEAIRRGVNNVVILDGRVPHSLLNVLLSDENAGTVVKGK